MASKNYIFYKIFKEDLDEVYVGCTSNFHSRKKNHKSNCYNEKRKQYNLKIYQTIRANGGWNEFKMIQIGTRENITKREAEQIEEEYRLELKATMNMCRAYRSQEDKKEYQKEYDKDYRQTNKEKISEKDKERYQANKDKILEKNKEYRQTNKEKINEQKKEHYQANKDKINERRSEVIICECGFTYTIRHKARHMKSQRHINNI
jgi:hypothetical protein